MFYFSLAVVFLCFIVSPALVYLFWVLMLKLSSFLTIVWWFLLKSTLSSSWKCTTEFYRCYLPVWVLSALWGNFFVLFFIGRCFRLLYCKSNLVYLFWVLMLKFSSFFTIIWWSLLKFTFLSLLSRFLLKSTFLPFSFYPVNTEVCISKLNLSVCFPLISVE